MPPTKECPMCGGMMQLKEIKSVQQVAGNPRPTTQVVREWTCPDCDYFEEAEKE